jgi:CO dehydrogenase maturation factor
MSKQEMLDLKIQESLVEAEHFDLIAMGRPEGPGCYCYANNVVRSVLERLADQYPAVVIDNEAGLENLSRRTVQQVNWLVFVADPSARGLTTARRLFDLAQEMEMKAEATGLVVNRVRDRAWEDRAKDLFQDTPVELLGTLPDDEGIARHDAHGLPVFDLPADNPVYRAAETILDRVTMSATCNA